MNKADVTSAVEVIRREQAAPQTTPRQELSEAIETVVRTTAETYTRESEAYAQARASQPWEQDARMTDLLLRLVRSRITNGELPIATHQKWRLLDVGAGYGRDVLRFSQEPDIAPVALENAPGFITALRRLQENGQLGPDAVVAGDMRDMTSIPTGSFHCVRNHATLHHLPVVSDGLGADTAVSECRRVLAAGGVFYVLVKAGEGVSMIDTKEGLGGRFFQLFTPAMLEGLLDRHAFKIVHMEELVETRGSTEVPWIFSLAVAV
jgi:SAM-dependent methyltransferase